MSQQPTEQGTLQEVRRLLAERAAKQKELEVIDHAINIAVGLEEELRPTRQTLSKKDFRNACRVYPNERIPAKKRQSLDSGLV